MARLAATRDEQVGARLFGDALAAAQPHPTSSAVTQLPVLSQIANAADTGRARDFCQKIAPRIPWTPTTRGPDNGTEIALCWIHELLTTKPMTAGITFMGANAVYPLHNHAPKELYLTISGTAQWRWGGAEELASVGPGQLLFNQSMDRHMMVAGDEPLLALWFLWD